MVALEDVQGLAQMVLGLFEVDGFSRRRLEITQTAPQPAQSHLFDGLGELGIIQGLNFLDDPSQFFGQFNRVSLAIEPIEVQAQQDITQRELSLLEEYRLLQLEQHLVGGGVLGVF